MDLEGQTKTNGAAPPAAGAPTVLKFGSSVLRAPGDVPRAVSEIYRRWRRGERVVAVVSAFRGRTDALLTAHDALGPATDALDPRRNALATLLGVGEIEAAALVALALERSGLPATLIRPEEVGIIAEGDPLEASPIGVDASAVRRALSLGRIAVVPGYVARSAEGGAVVLGRGGSDLTAICLADALGVEAVLVKDVGWVYEWDPSDAGPAPQRFVSLSYEDALALGDRVVQPRAIEHARAIGRGFAVRGVQSDEGTRVGEVGTRLAPALESRGRPLRVALLGLGSVGLGVAQRLALEPDRFELVGALVRDGSRPRPGTPEGLFVTDDPGRLLRSRPDVVVELIGGVEEARAHIEAALVRGADVVTANKAVLARDGASLVALADAQGRLLLASASVGGALPALERVRATRATGRVRRVSGVLNGATNFILNALRGGVGFEAAIERARALGYAEADVSADIEGLDAAHKLSLLARELGVPGLSVGEVTREALDASSAARVRGAPGAVRQVATLELLEGGAARASVRLETQGPGSWLADLGGALNALGIESWEGETRTVVAAGAGRWPTTESVFADLCEVASRRRLEEPPAGPARWSRGASGALGVVGASGMAGARGRGGSERR